MASRPRPTDPAKLAALRATDAARAARYRARQRAALAGERYPAEARKRSKATYVPPRVRPARTPQTELSKAQAQAERAQRAAESQRERRRAALARLDSILSPGAKIRPVMETPRTIGKRFSVKGNQENIAAFRLNTEAKRLANVGRARRESYRNELSNNDTLRGALTPRQAARFQRAVDRITDKSVSNQALGIYTVALGGSNEYSNIIERLIYPFDSETRDDILDKLDVMADRTEKAGRAYAPKVIGTIRD